MIVQPFKGYTSTKGKHGSITYHRPKRIPIIYWREIKSFSELNSKPEKLSVIFENGRMYLKELINAG